MRSTIKRKTTLAFRLLPVLLVLPCLAALASAPRGQPATQSLSTAGATDDRVALHQALLDLTNPWTVMCIAAHPDDEDGTSLIVMRRKYGAHTVSLFTTFGEGGQNAIGPELYEDLGAIRARETMAAAEIQGSEPHFLGLKDFGYSKSGEEAFRVWGRNESLRRMVLQIRKLRPDVIITNHDTERGHGHHQATGQLVLGAFDAAADPKRFPEQLKNGITTWRVQRLFLRVGFGNQAGQKPDREGGLVTIDPNERDPIRGMTFAEEALRALQKHATQGPWPKTIAEMSRFRNSADGKLPLIRYRLVRYAKDSDITNTPPAFEMGLDSHNVVDGLRLPEDVAKRLEPPTIGGRPIVEYVDNRSLVLEQLVKSRPNYLMSLGRSHDRRLLVMIQKVERALALAAGVTFNVEPSIVVTPNSTVDLPLKISNSGSQTVDVLRCDTCAANSICIDDGSSLITVPSSQSAKGGGIVQVDKLTPGSAHNRANKLQIPDKMPINIPLSSHLYEPNAFGLQVNTSCSIQFGNIRAKVMKSTRVDVAPPVEIAEISPAPVVLTPKTYKRPIAFTLALRSHSPKTFNGAPMVEGLAGHAEPFGAPLRLRPQESKRIAGQFIPTLKTLIEADGTAKPLPGHVWFGILATGGSLVSERRVPVFYADAKVSANLRVGYIRGFDNSLPDALAALKVESKGLSVDDVRAENLQKYTAVIVDNRVYESQPELIAANQKLLDYAKGGGTLIVFYHKSNEWNPDARRNRPQLAPYPIILNDERVTDENAPITFLNPTHRLLNVPNKIGQEDFAGWIQERGLYYPKEWDSQYQALLATNDPGEAPLKGGMLVGDYGRGHYIYSSMVWYRQLRAGVPGAYRMLANMISYGRTTESQHR